MAVAIHQQLEEAALRLVARWGALLRALDQWPLDHASHRHPLQGMAEAFADLHRLGGRVRLVVRADHLEIDGRRVVATAATRAPLQVLEAHLRARSIDGFELSGAPTPDLVTEAVRLIADAGAEGVSAVNAALPTRGVVELRCLARDDGDALAAAERGLDPAARLLYLYLRGVGATERMAQGEPLSVVGAELARVIGGFVQLYPAAPGRTLALLVAGRRLPYAARHPLHVALLAVALGHRLGLDDAHTLELGLCAVAVDCGMAQVPAELRSAPRPLDEAEQDVVREHPLHSVRALLSAAAMGPSLQRRLLVAFEHHLGAADGYPAALDWPRPHLFSRVVAVADAFDAITSERWRPARSPSAALLEMRLDARLDPQLVELLGELVHAHGAALGDEPRGGVARA